MNNPAINIRIPIAKLWVEGIICKPRITSRKTPISTIFEMVPSPTFSPSKMVRIKIIAPTIIEAVPKLIPVVFENPTWKTSQGAYPILAFSVTTIPSAYRISQQIKRSRRR